jgi:hypothetical protein
MTRTPLINDEEFAFRILVLLVHRIKKFHYTIVFTSPKELMYLRGTDCIGSSYAQVQRSVLLLETVGLVSQIGDIKHGTRKLRFKVNKAGFDFVKDNKYRTDPIVEFIKNSEKLVPKTLTQTLLYDVMNKLDCENKNDTISHISSSTSLISSSTPSYHRIPYICDIHNPQSSNRVNSTYLRQTNRYSARDEMISGQNPSQSATTAQAAPRTRSPRRKPPQRLNPKEQFEFRAQEIKKPQIDNLERILKKLHKETYHHDFWKFTKHEKQYAQRLIQFCIDSNWDLEDFLKVQFEWFAKFTRRHPVMSNLCGVHAKERYDNWLREHDYSNDLGDAIASDGESRMKDLKQMRATKERMERAARLGILPSQREARLEKHLEKFRNKLTEEDIRKAFDSVSALYPPWLMHSLSKDDIRERGIHRAIADERTRIVGAWHMFDVERSRLTALITIEIETGKRSPCINVPDLRKFGLPEWMVEEHEAICRRDNNN